MVAVAVRTPPLVALQRSTTRATPLERPFRFILIFAGDAQAHRQLLRIPRGCESIIPLVCRKTSAFRDWYCDAFRLLIVGVVYAARLLDLSQLRCGKQLLTPDTARRCESIVPLHHAMQRSACSRRAQGCSANLPTEASAKNYAPRPYKVHVRHKNLV